jgi:uncharacterized protein YjbI with pentapeptide repeats
MVVFLGGEVMLMTPEELLERYKAGERNFAGIRFRETIANCLTGVDLSDIDLSGAYLRMVRFSEVNLTRAKMVGAYLPNACFGMANLFKVDLTGATLWGTQWQTVSLREANLTDANLTGAIMNAVDVTYAIFDRSNLTQVNLTKLEFCGNIPEMYEIQASNAILWQTTLPDGTFEVGPIYFDDRKL